MNYLIGITWLICLFLFFYTVGCAFSKQNRCGPFKILTGYIVYSLGVALPGIVIQILNLEYSLFRNLMWAWICSLLIVSFFILYKKGNLKLPDAGTVREFLTNYWVFILIILGVLFLSALNYPAYWLGNRSDDGYYLSQIASYPVVEKPFEYNLATGLYTGHVINSYSLNTHELEASVFFQTLGIPIGLFTRVFMAAEGYIIFGCCIYSMSHEVFKMVNGKSRYLSSVQFSVCLLLLFSANWIYLSNNGILYIQDSWQTSTAMYYGSSIPRTSGFYLLLLPFISGYKINLRTIIKVILISIVLVSKSTIAVPIIFLGVISYVLVWLVYESNCRKGLVVFFLFGAGIVGSILSLNIEYIGPAFDSLLSIKNTSFLWVKSIVKSLIPFIMIIAVILSFSLKNRKIWQLLCLVFLIAVFLFVPGFNFYVCSLSFFTFVIGRTITAFVYFIAGICTSVTISFLVSLRIRKSILTVFGLIISALLFTLNFKSFLQFNGNAEILPGQEGTALSIADALNVISKNPNFMPISTERLAAKLNQLQKEKGKLAVLTETYYQSDGVADLKHVLTRSLSPNVIFPTANTRFITTADPIYGSFTVEKQAIFESFLINNDPASTAIFGQLLDEYMIDAVVLREKDIYDANMNQLGFSLYETIMDDNGNPAYYLYAR